MPFEIIREDITNLKTDAIVNATNNRLKASGGVCGAIFKKAGLEKLQKECDKIGHIDTSQAVITKGYDLDCKYIIHTVGPIWHGGDHDEEKLLYNTYLNCLNLAKRKRCKSIAFPLISSGNFGYPKDKALHTARRAIEDFLAENDLMIYLVVFDKNAFAISQSLFDSIKQYIDDNYLDGYRFDNSRRNAESSLLDDYFHMKIEPTLQSVSDSIENDEIKMFEKAPKPINATKSATKFKSKSKKSSVAKDILNNMINDKNLIDAVSNVEDTFSQTLLRLIDATGKSDSEIYKKANIDRRLFSKIRKNKDYSPSKSTALSLAIALELDIDETKDLLEKAGYALSHSNKFDIIVEYFIKEQNYNIFEINEALFAFDQNILKA
ncbi:MAG: macro domain-containing protein [Intestinibacter sp.]